VRALGIDVGGTNVKWVVLDLTAEPIVVAEGHAATHAELGPRIAIERMAELARRTAETLGPIDRLGIGMPGPLDLERGRTIFLGNLPGWEDCPVVEPLEQRLGLPVALINDARAFTLAELEAGAGRGVATMVAITLGTGVGGGIVVDGRLLLGMNGTVGEIGHQTIEPDGPRCGCGNRGCLEQFVSGPAIARAAGAETAEQVVEAGRAGDSTALDVLARAGSYLGIGIANVMLAVGPERVVVGGGVADAGDLLLGPAREELRRRVTVMPIDRVEIVRAELGLQAGAIGAALWAAAAPERG
jgi:glucokinase